MSANMLSVSLDDLFQLHSGKLVLNPYTTIEQPITFCGRVWQPYIEDEILTYQQNQSPPSSAPIIEDEETCHEFLPYVYGCGSSPSRELCQTVSPLQSWNTDVAVDQMQGRSLNWATGFNACHLTSCQELQVSTCNQTNGATVTSSFNPSVDHQSFEHTPVSIVTDESVPAETEHPTDLSMPKYSLQNVDSERTAFDNIHSRLTHTHLSDISNDSNEDFDEIGNIPKSFNHGLAKKPFEKLRPYQLAQPWMSTTCPVTEAPSMATFDPMASYTQMVMDLYIRSIIDSYISWLLQPIIHHIEMSQKFSEQIPTQKQKIIELEEDSDYKHNDAIQNVAGRQEQPSAKENQVIDLTQSDNDDENGMSNEHLHVQPSPSNHPILAEELTLEERIQRSKISLQRPKFSVSTHTLTSESCLESKKISVDSIISSKKDFTVDNFLSQRSSFENTSAQQNYCPSPILEDHVNQHLTYEPATDFLRDTSPIRRQRKRPYMEPGAVCDTAVCTGPKQPRRSQRLQCIAKEPTCANVIKNDRSRNRQVGNHEGNCVAPSQPRRSPRFQRAAIKCAPSTIKKRSDPWHHKGLMRFIAEFAFELPPQVWKQKDNTPRRSGRLAKKMQRNRYLLRTRLHMKR